MDSPITTTDGDMYVAALVAVFSRAEQAVLNLAIVALAVFILMVTALVVALWLERRQQRQAAAFRAAVDARIAKGVLR